MPFDNRFFAFTCALSVIHIRLFWLKRAMVRPKSLVAIWGKSGTPLLDWVDFIENNNNI